jgi:hypothetical protein
LRRRSKPVVEFQIVARKDKGGVDAQGFALILPGEFLLL